MVGSAEVSFKANGLLDAADKIQLAKYCAINTANAFGKTITFRIKSLQRVKTPNAP